MTAAVSTITQPPRYFMLLFVFAPALRPLSLSSSFVYPSFLCISRATLAHPRHHHRSCHHRPSVSSPHHSFSFMTTAPEDNIAPPSLSSSSSSRTSSFSSSFSSSLTPSASAKTASAKTLYDYILPGTHDSAAYTSSPGISSRIHEQTPLTWRPMRSMTSTLATEFALTQQHSVLHQLQSGARFLDLRVTKRPRYSPDPDTFWTHHGIVLCIPLIEILQQINRFHLLNNKKDTVILVFRATLLSKEEEQQLSDYVTTNLQHDIYNKSADELRTTPLTNLPNNIVAGLPNYQLQLDWGEDAWIDTYDPVLKTDFLRKTLLSTPPRSHRNHLLVVGWTVTPSLLDIVLRVVSFGMARSPLLPQAVVFNSFFNRFLDRNRRQLLTTANVIFFDAFNADLARQVNTLNNVHLQPASITTKATPPPSTTRRKDNEFPQPSMTKTT